MTHQLTPLRPEVFEAFIGALVDALVEHYRTHWNAESPRDASPPVVVASSAASPWLTAKDAAERARCGVKILYREVNARRLRAARVGAGRNMRFHIAWIDEWLLEQSKASLRPK